MNTKVEKQQKICLFSALESYRMIYDNDKQRDKADKLWAETKDLRAVHNLCKELFMQEQAQKALAKSMITKRFAKRDFESFKPQNYHYETHKKALELCRSYAEDFGIGTKTNLIIAGEGCVGTGKTHLATAIALYVMREKAIPAKWVNAASIFFELQKDFESPKNLVLDEFCNTPLLVLDDLGKEHQKDWLKQMLYVIINHRYDNELPTVITVEKSLSAIEKQYDGAGKALISRLLEDCKRIKLDGEDYRKRNSARLKVL